MQRVTLANSNVYRIYSSSYVGSVFVIRQGMDVETDAVTHNLLSDLGFLKGLELTLRLIAFGLFFGGLPCKSYTFMSSATHGRSALTSDGKPYPFVLEGSILLDRWSIMALVAVARGAVWLLEHPDRSTIDLMPTFQTLLASKLNPLTVKWFLPQLAKFCVFKHASI